VKLPCYRSRMEVIEAEFNDGVLRPMRHLSLRPGERVGIVVVRRPDPSRWDLVRLSKLVPDEETLTKAGLSEWEAALQREDRS
jgi:predicted DNA-binding antitoxin AbrB/MazE fold protein